ncbi:MAG: hypothetical protein P1V97_11245 [Planctomycetota bacterium]|nr:hypothetical protein [Planctomycetota bacterium]
MKSIHHPLISFQKCLLERDFSELARSAEHILGESGFMVTKESARELRLVGPPYFNEEKILSSFAKISFKQNGQDLHITAEFRSDHSPLARWRKQAFMGLIGLSNVLALVLFFSGIPSRQPELLPVITIPIVFFGLIAGFKLRPRKPDNAPEANLALDNFLDEISFPKQS